MNLSSLQQKLLRRTTETLHRRDRAFDPRRGDPPRPGDLFVFRRTAEFDVHWAILERHPSAPGQFLVVAADVHPLVGGADVAIGADAFCGAMSLRCRQAVWVAEWAFEPSLYLGCLSAKDLERGRRKLAENEGGAFAPNAIDTEAEYRAWTEGVLDKARASLAELSDPGAVGPRK